MKPILYIITPCYNEEEALPHSAPKLVGLLLQMAESGLIDGASRLTLVDDGSRDNTWKVIEALIERYPQVEGLKLAHNAGHQNALWAGMMTVRGKADAIVTIDADLQDDVNAIPKFVEKLNEGADVVYGVRKKRQTDTAFKRATAHGFYRFMRAMGADVVDDHADYRLLSRRALDALSDFGEVNLFLRGMVPLLGFKTDKVYYDRGERVAGESKYPLRKMLAFAVEGITSFSVKPIKLVIVLGFLFALLGLMMALYAIVQAFLGQTASGWASLMVSVWVVGGVQLMALGLIGTYVGKIYTEVKRRPRFIVETYKGK
jgi:glycosyltransferase involved in cell wall biosynthesis